MRRTLAFLAPLALLTGCPTFGEKPADEGPHCEDTKTPIGFDEVTALGFSANDKLAEVPMEEAATFVYADGTTTDLTVGFAPAEGAYFVDSEAVYPEDGPSIDIAVICDDRIEVEGMFAFATADGAFSESFASVLAATAESLGIYQELDLDHLNGTFAIEPFVDAEGYDDVRAWISASFAAGQSRGSVEGQASGEDECSGDECSAWATSVPVGTWDAAADE